MGFPVDCTDFFVPKLFIHALFFLGLFRSILQSFFDFLGLSYLIEPAEVAFLQENPTPMPLSPPMSAVLIRELLPAGKLSDLVAGVGCKAPETCAVCLYEFEDGEEIRFLRNCKHIFHRSCIDRWMDHDQRTCPLCRTALVPRHKEEEFNQRLWAATASACDFEIYGYQDEYSSSALLN